MSLVILGLVLSGCASKPAEKLVSVSGKITLKGKPFTTGFVAFHPDPEKYNDTAEEPRGNIDDTGTYTVNTRKGQGVPPGWYKVSVMALKETPKGQQPIWLIHQKYANPATSGLTVEVVANSPPGAYDLKLQP